MLQILTAIGFGAGVHTLSTKAKERFGSDKPGSIESEVTNVLDFHRNRAHCAIGISVVV